MSKLITFVALLGGLLVVMFENFLSKYFYEPDFLCRLLSLILSPLAIIYSFIIKFKFFFRKKEIDFKIPIISVGNLVVGGSGKSPLTKAIYEFFKSKGKRAFIVLRGYKRKSKGCIVVCENSQILVSTSVSGDEAMDYALNGANVIVSEDRKEGILKAIEHGADVVILDDGFRHFEIKKFDILLRPFKEPKSDFCLPSGAYRMPKSFYKLADFIPENSDIERKTKILNPTEKMVLVSGIANPSRLSEFYANCVAYYHFGDHYDFSSDELQKILAKHGATSLLVTSKDYAKIKDFGLPLSIIKLEIILSQNFKKMLETCVK